jgi:hypothetical protein
MHATLLAFVSALLGAENVGAEALRFDLLRTELSAG